MITVTVPSGIGDVSWIYSKLCNAGVPISYELADGWPYRAVPYMQMLEHCAGAKYSDVEYGTIVRLAERARLWRDIIAEPKGIYYLECNQHLERGQRLEDWLPDLPTSFHYKLADPSPRDLVIVNGLLDWETVARPVIGISAASYRGSKAWDTWGYDQWSPFLKALRAKTGGTIVLLGGFWDDLTHSIAQDGYSDFVGKTSVSQAVEVLRRLDYYVGFSSGLGILRTVLAKPTYMLWPDHQAALASSWAPLDMIASGAYAHSHWLKPNEVLARVMDVFPQGEQLHFSFFEKSTACPTTS